jgi:hypothetical protein
VEDGGSRIFQDCLNVSARQFRVATQKGIPRFILSQLLENCGHGNSRAFDDRLSVADAWIDFNSVRQQLNLGGWT